MDEPQKAIEELSTEERATLETAHERLRQAVADYDKFVGGALPAGRDTPTLKAEEMEASQAEVQEAEAELWTLREMLLGWRRPSWAQSATAVSDWFSEEDSDYDDYPLTSTA